ncbi:Outer membrane protein [Treponema sp. JC4]|uniref:TolC family protein n=1 Tax=Treponema sp. JC4 TaxID=1124982 RepID=UPI00025B0BDB|nr:TolC family protein [Treponema sp. JC4]EID85750.1 Outer membrane protein [Treponema sp. JC4]
MFSKRFIFAVVSLFFSINVVSAEKKADENTVVYEDRVFTLYDAITLAIQHNYDVRKQQQALIIAEAKYRQAKGALDLSIGAEGDYTYSQNPVDPRDPNYLYGYSFITPESVYGIFSKNSLTRQGSGSIFMQKLFSIGLQSKLSYSVKRTNNVSDYEYGDAYAANTYKKYKDEHGRNLGELSLELSLPLFKSFNSSVTALQISQAKDYLDQMRFQLQDTISQTVINTTKAYWAYFMAYKNLNQLEILQQKFDTRNANIDSMVRAGILMKNDILLMKVSVSSNQRSLDSAKVEYFKTKMDLANMLGTSDLELIENPADMFQEMNLNDEPDVISVDDIDENLLAYVEENRIDFRMLKDQISSAKKGIKIAKINGRPDATLGFKIGMNGTTYSDDAGETVTSGFWNVRGANINGSIGVTIKPFDRDTSGKVMEAKANYETLMIDYEKNRNTLYLQLKNCVEKLNLYRNSLLKAEGVYEMQSQLYNNEQERFRAGLIKLDNLIEQDQKFIQATQERYQTLVNYLEALLEYKYATASIVGIDVEPTPAPLPDTPPQAAPEGEEKAAKEVERDTY